MRARCRGLLVIAGVVFLAAGTGAVPGFAAPALQGDPQAVAEVQAAFQKFAAAPSWRARIALAGGQTQTMEFVAPDRFHMLLAGTTSSEMFIVGHNSWMRMQGKCQKLPGSPPFANPREMMGGGSDARIAVTKGGVETVEGTPTQTYLMTIDTKGQQLQEKLYVATGTGLPRRIETRPAGGGGTTIDYMDYGAAITIADPPC
ncbi:MAG TPA: hypothetical protein VKV57_15530 [bacterium]|nr:hypothetical protein [bacterium]